MGKEEILKDEVEKFEKEAKKQKLQLSKFESVELERFSPSSFNSFRRNRMTWALRYIFKFHSRYPMFSAYRGNVIEKQIQNYLSIADEKMTMQDYVQEAVEMYHHMIILNLFQKGLYEHTARGFNTDSLAVMLKGIDKERFPKVIETILVTHNKLNTHVSLPAFTNPEDEDFGKYLRKLEKEYALIYQGVTEGIKYFTFLREKKFAYQRRLEVQAYNLVIPTISYSDFEDDDDKMIYELKTVSPQKMPKEFNKIDLGHKTQMAFNVKYRKREGKLVYISSVSEKAVSDYQRDIFIHNSLESGMSVEEIVKSYVSPNGGKTTKPYIEKYRISMNEPGYEKPIEPTPIREYKFTLSDADQFDKVNYRDAQAINSLFEKANKNSFDEDIKNLCWSNPEEMMVDKDQKDAIEKIWGIELQESEEEEI